LVSRRIAVVSLLAGLALGAGYGVAAATDNGSPDQVSDAAAITTDQQLAADLKIPIPEARHYSYQLPALSPNSETNNIATGYRVEGGTADIENLHVEQSDASADGTIPATLEFDVKQVDGDPTLVIINAFTYTSRNGGGG
jgi:hypothetical protein